MTNSKSSSVSSSSKFIFLAFVFTFSLFFIQSVSAQTQVMNFQAQCASYITGAYVISPSTIPDGILNKPLNFYANILDSNAKKVNYASMNTSFYLLSPDTNRLYYLPNGNITLINNILKVNIPASFFNETGEYGFYWESNDGTKGGCVQGEINITPTGLTSSIAFYIIWIILSLGVILIGYYAQDQWVVVLGSFILVLFGLYVLFFGIVDVKDTVYTWGIGITTLMLGTYFGIRGAIEGL